jgi:hypothetical protein
VNDDRKPDNPDYDLTLVHAVERIDWFEHVIARLRDLGVLGERDMAIVDARRELRDTQLRAMVARDDRDGRAEAFDEMARALESKLRALEAPGEPTESSTGQRYIKH